MKIYENKILRILGFIFIWIYVFGVGICFAGRWYAIGIPGVVLLLVWLNHNLIGAAIRRYRARQAIKQIKKHGTRLSVDLSNVKSVRRNGVARSQGCKSQSLRYSIHGKPSFGMVLAALCFLTFIIVNK